MALNITGMERSPCMRRWITATGRVHGKTTPGHTGGLVVFLQEIFSLCPRQQIHIILHSLSAHKTALVRAFLETPPPRTVPFQCRILFLVRRNRTRGYRARSLHFGSRFRPQLRCGSSGDNLTTIEKFISISVKDLP